MNILNRLTAITALSAALTCISSTAHAGTYAAPVQVANTDTSPVPVRDVTHPSRKPIQITLHQDGNVYGSYFVPADKRLVIEQISGNAYLPSISPGVEYVVVDTTISAADSVDGQVAHSHHFFTLSQPNASVYVLSNQLVKFYASAGTKVQVEFPVARDDTPGVPDGSINFTFTGYLEDAS